MHPKGKMLQLKFISLCLKVQISEAKDGENFTVQDVLRLGMWVYASLAHSFNHSS